MAKDKPAADAAPTPSVESRVAELELTVTTLQKQLRGHRHDAQNADAVVLLEEPVVEVVPQPEDTSEQGGNQ